MAGETLDLIRSTIGKEIPNAGLTRDGVLVKLTRGTRTAGDLDGGTNPTPTRHRFKGFYDDRQLSKLPDSLVQRGDRMVLMLGDTIQGGAEPEPSDEVELEGETTTIDRVVERDPANATYLCLVRKT